MTVRFGSLADIRSAKGRVRFAPKSDRKSGHIRVLRVKDRRGVTSGLVQKKC